MEIDNAVDAEDHTIGQAALVILRRER